MIYFDNGASSHPKPKCVINAVGEWLRKNGANPGRSGHKLSMEAAEMIYDTRVAVGGLFGMDRPENVILAPNATYALNTVLLGLFEAGDHVITTDLEHNSVLRPLWHLQKSGIKTTIVPVNFEDHDKTIDSILEKIEKNTRAIVCTQCSNVCGLELPIEKLARVKPENIKIIVDGSQGAGIVPLDVVKSGIDYYCAPSHKGLMGPQGGGFILVNNRSPRPLVFGGTGTKGNNPEQPLELPEYLESGTLPAPICAGMLAAARYVASIGIGQIYKEKQALMQYAYEKLRTVPEIQLYAEDYFENCVGVIPFNLKDYHSGDITSALNERGIYTRGGIHCAPLYHRRMGTEHRGMVRISFGYYNTRTEVDVMVKTLKKFLR